MLAHGPAKVAEALGLGNRSSATSFFELLKLKLEVESCPQLYCWLTRLSVPRPVFPRRCASTAAS
jgi:hypothetical protein